jgi:hypothetical protein
VAAVGALQGVLAVPEVDRLPILDLAGATAKTGLFHSAHLLSVGSWFNDPAPRGKREGGA